MPGLIDDVLELDAQAFVDPDLFPGCEELIALYLPNSDTVARSINVTVWRNEPRKVAGEVKVIPLVIFVRNHATAGVTSIDPGGHRFGVAAVYGGTATPRFVARVISSDAGGFLLELK